MKATQRVTGLTLDTGSLLALERGDSRIRALLRRAVDGDLDIAVPAGVIAQAWRGGPRQARIARLLGDTRVDTEVLDDPSARAVGLLCGRSGHADVVDVHVVLCARLRGHAVVTSDPEDVHGVDPTLRLIRV